jgi:hypothetical protein
MPQSIELILSLLAGILIVLAQLIYISQVVKKQVTPSVMSWIGWAIFIGTSFIAQLIELGWNWSLIGLLLSTIGCATISVYSLLSKNFTLKNRDWIYLFAGLACIYLYVTFSDPLLTTLFAIAADFVLGIPTILKAIQHPKTEKSRAWGIAVASWTFTLIICLNHDLIYALFPIYLFCFNGMMVLLTSRRRLFTVK